MEKGLVYNEVCPKSKRLSTSAINVNTTPSTGTDCLPSTHEQQLPEDQSSMPGNHTETLHNQSTSAINLNTTPSTGPECFPSTHEQVPEDQSSMSGNHTEALHNQSTSTISPITTPSSQPQNLQSTPMCLSPPTPVLPGK